MADYEKIGKEVRALFTAYPVEPETEEGRMVADLRYPGWREKGMPPAVPTPEAVERWGEWWWYYGSIVQVFERGGRLFAYEFGDDAEHCVKGMGPEWAGPVLERPVKP